ncbi:MAG TPA: amino acid adenylation domain-containing protein [Bacilli bacterium]|nr:amino acid adenylation domain-containing protein [Bacilli bacterium]
MSETYPSLSVEAQRDWHDPQLRGLCAHELFEAQAAQTPDRTAVVDAVRSLTYRELNERANRLAHLLRKKGVGAESLVALCMDRSVELVVAVLAILKAGGAFVPLDPTYPQERIALILEDTQASVIVTEAKWESLLATAGVQGAAAEGATESKESKALSASSTASSNPAKIVTIDTAKDALDAQPCDNLQGVVQPQHLAYLIYTSGSTGRPKAVMVEHRNLTATLCASQVHFGFRSDDVMPWIASVAFDIAFFELFNPLLVGGTSVVLTKEQVLDLPQLLDDVEGFTRMHAVPSLMRGLVQAIQEQGRDLTRYDGIRMLFTGGDAVPPDLLSDLQETFTQAGVRVLYGPTEGTIICSQYDVPRGGELDKFMIGTAMEQAQLRICKEDGQEVADGEPGEPGELLIGGAGVTRGYFNRPDLTNEKFIAWEKGRWYKTGDLVRRSVQEGTLEFLGRIDNQVKIRGFRIELGEIEAALNRLPDVRESVVIAREDTPGDKRLVAYVVLTDACALGGSELRAELQASLPEYMVPGVFVVMEKLPLNPNGKIDRKQLPVPTRDHAVAAGAYVAPRNEQEQLLADVFADVLGLERVGVSDSFFELGGHSLLATKILVRLREGHGIELRLEDLFRQPTVEELAPLVARGREQQTGATKQVRDVPALEAAPRTERMALSFPQERVWFIRQLAPSSHSYTFQVGFRFRGALDVAALEASLSAIIERHEIFRTTFPAVDGKPYQQIHEPWRVQVPIVDLTALATDAQRERETERLIAEEIRKPFDMTQLPLVRWTLLKLADDHHILVHVEDHLVHDGWSFTVFARELVALYGAQVLGTEALLPELPLQFADYAAWQKRWMNCGEATTQLQYWTEQLGAAEQVLDLPTDKPRPAQQGFQGRVLRVDLPAPLAEAVRGMSRREGVTLFMSLFAAFNTLLYRYTGQENILVGSALANRRWQETESMMGMIVTNIVLRTQPQAEMPFRELLKQVRDVALEGFAHQDLPFEKIVEALKPERDLSRNPLFQVSFSFHDSQMPPLTMPGLDVELIEGLSNGTSKFDMNIIAIPRREQRVGVQGSEGDDGITLLWEYDTELFAAETIERMVEQYKRLLHAVVADPGLCLANVPLLPDAERWQLADWNDTEVDFAESMCVQEQFALQAERNPERVAVVMGDTRLTYAELNRRANLLAHLLQKGGVGTEDCVGICLERSPELVVAVLAVVKAGAAYVPMDVKYPQERLAHMAQDADVKMLLTRPEWVELFAGLDVPLVLMDEMHGEGDETQIPTTQTTLDNLAYIIYTSGSTGTPKGVEIEHKSLHNLIAWTRQTFGLNEQDRTTLLAGTAFDASVWEVWTALTSGACLYIPSEETRLNPSALARELASQGITVCFLPTPLAERVLQEELSDDLQLRYLCTGGDQLHPVRDELPFTLVNLYGPTESTVVATGIPLTQAASDDRDAFPPIGRPIANVQAYVVDANLQPTPIGVPGELLIGGRSLARGYRNRPDLTAEKFIQNPFSHDENARLYRTGDLVRWLPSGQLEFLGRLDTQVKIRGFRIELGEIEAVLHQLPEVKEAVVIAWEESQGQRETSDSATEQPTSVSETVGHHNGITGVGRSTSTPEKRLIAYLVYRDDQDVLSSADLQTRLQRQLPDYMIPSVFLTLESLPLTPNGKVDLRALPQPTGEEYRLSGHDAMTTDAQPSQTPTEKQVAAVFAQVLGHATVARHDDFFHLGGHSLLVTQVISRLRDAFAVEIALSDFFKDRTVAKLAARVETMQQAQLAEPSRQGKGAGTDAQASQAASETAHIPPVTAVSRESTLPLSYAQQRLLFVSQLTGGSLYNIPVALRLTGPLQRDLLQQSLQEIIRRHESLRTTFAEGEDEQPMQVIHAPEPLPLTLTYRDLRDRPQAEREQAERELVRQEGRHPFDLEKGPLFRATVAQLDDEVHVLVINVHHIVFDGWSMGLFTRELGELYTAYLQGEPHPLPPLSLHYADYAVWQRKHLQGEWLDNQLAYWTTKLGGELPVLHLPTDRPRLAAPKHDGAVYRFELPTDLAADIKELAQQQGTTVYMTALAAFKALLARYTDLEDILVGTPVAGRNRRELEDVIGFFVNTLVLRTDLSGDPTFCDLLARVKETALGAFAHQETPFDKLVEELQPERKASHNPLFQVMFVWQTLPLQPLALPGLTLETMESHHGIAKFDLTLTMRETEDGLSGYFEYDTELWEPDTIRRMTGHLQTLLASAVAKPDTPISALSWVEEEVDLDADELDELFT